MKKEQAAQSYAYSLIELGESTKVKIDKDFDRFNQYLGESDELHSLLFLPIFTIEEKNDVLKDIFKKASLSPLFQHFIFFLIGEKRFHLIPLIYREVKTILGKKSGHIKGIIESSHKDLDSEVGKLFKKYIKSKINLDVDFEHKTNPSVSAGYRVTVEDLQLDTTLDYQLDMLKDSIVGDK